MISSLKTYRFRYRKLLNSKGGATVPNFETSSTTMFVPICSISSQLTSLEIAKRLQLIGPTVSTSIPQGWKTNSPGLPREEILFFRIEILEVFSNSPQAVKDQVRMGNIMSQSIAPECTDLKKKYDDCFNGWYSESECG